MAPKELQSVEDIMKLVASTRVFLEPGMKKTPLANVIEACLIQLETIPAGFEKAVANEVAKQVSAVSHKMEDENKVLKEATEKLRQASEKLHKVEEKNSALMAARSAKLEEENNALKNTAEQVSARLCKIEEENKALIVEKSSRLEEENVALNEKIKTLEVHVIDSSQMEYVTLERDNLKDQLDASNRKGKEQEDKIEAMMRANRFQEEVNERNRKRGRRTVSEIRANHDRHQEAWYVVREEILAILGSLIAVCDQKGGLTLEQVAIYLTSLSTHKGLARKLRDFRVEANSTQWFCLEAGKDAAESFQNFPASKAPCATKHAGHNCVLMRNATDSHGANVVEFKYKNSVEDEPAQEV